jgi:hypothetical protein
MVLKMLAAADGAFFMPNFLAGPWIIFTAKEENLQLFKVTQSIILGGTGALYD